MRKTTLKCSALANKIVSALCMLDEKGTNHFVTKAMTIVCLAFERQASKRNFCAIELYNAAIQEDAAGN